jgi:hypothetical protein
VPKDRLRARERHRYGGSVELAPQNRSTVGYMALVVLLAAGLAIGVALFILQARGPGSEAEFTVATAQAVDCPAGSGVPVCYRFDVTNTGRGAGPVRCLVAPTGGGSAAFTASGTNAYQSDGPVAVGDTYSLYTEVEAAEGEDVVDRPTVGCRTA